jgi:transcription antitermination factor NusG
MQERTKSTLLIAGIREEADAKESVGKSQMARRARFAASSIEKCFGEGKDFALSEINKAWLDEYLCFLQGEHKTDNTISSYIRTILSTFRSAVKSGEELDLTLFDGYFTGNSKSTKKIPSADDVKCIISSDLKDAVFKRTRDIFSLCFFGGGLRIGDLQSMSQTSQYRLNATDEAKSILRHCAQGGLLSFLGENPRQAYIHNLSGLAHKLKIKAKLDDDSAAEGWAEIAKNIGISHDTISNIVGRHIDNLNYANDVVIGNEEISQALVRVAGSIGVNSQHWYAIRCYADTPEDTAVRIKSLPLMKSLEIKHYFLDDEAKKKGGKNTTTQKNYLKPILFLRCLDADIYYIRRTLAPSIYVFDYLCSTEKRPAIISDKEMKTFMYLAGLGSESMTYYFPEEIANIPSYEEYEDVTITDGVFAGVNAKVYKKSKEKLNVIVRFEQANIWYTVDIPYSLLKPKVVNE